jgi:hypothetical protein
VRARGSEIKIEQQPSAAIAIVPFDALTQAGRLAP